MRSSGPREPRSSACRIKASPFIPGDIPASGWFYDVRTGRLEEARTRSAREAR